MQNAVYSGLHFACLNMHMWITVNAYMLIHTWNIFETIFESMNKDWQEWLSLKR